MPTFFFFNNIFNQNGVRVQTAYLVPKFFRKKIFLGGNYTQHFLHFKKKIPLKILSYNNLYLYNELHHCDF